MVQNAPMAGSADVVRLEGAQTAWRLAFLGWQCRLRQLAARQDGGRPSDGMRPELYVRTAGDGERRIGRVTVLLNKADNGEAATRFRYMAHKTVDPVERWEAVIGLLQASHFQEPASFDDELSALFAADDPFPLKLAHIGHCRLVFEQFRQRWELPCSVRLLRRSERDYQATWWHNLLFNPKLPGDPQILGFRPDWKRAQADPAPA